MRQNQRQLKHSRLKHYAVKNLIPATDTEGVTSETFPDPAFTVKGEVWPATGKRQVEMYGDRVNGISNMRIVGQYELTTSGAFSCIVIDDHTIRQGDGVYVLADPETQDPDYRVISITPYQPVKMEIERR